MEYRLQKMEQNKKKTKKTPQKDKKKIEQKMMDMEDRQRWQHNLCPWRRKQNKSVEKHLNMSFKKIFR